MSSPKIFFSYILPDLGIDFTAKKKNTRKLLILYFFVVDSFMRPKMLDKSSNYNFNVACFCFI